MADDYIKRSDAINAYKASRSKDNHKNTEGSLVHVQEHNHILHIIDKLPAADVVEVDVIKQWLYMLASNNVGVKFNGDFSKACEEIALRLDGLISFAREKSGGPR